ncbi:MAG: hypothetical protein RL030_1252 [Pseudomonadota bacterium]
MLEAALTFDDLQRVLVQIHALTDAAEAHGTLVGALCSTDCSLDDWLGQILPDGRTEDPAAARLRAIFESTCESLGDGTLGFAPLLPTDEASIGDRTTALGEWCQGFLYGLGTGPLPEQPALQGDAAEVLRDLTEITHVDVDPEEDEEQNEQAYTELVEFVRVGVQLVYAHLTPLRETPPDVPKEMLH